MFIFGSRMYFRKNVVKIMGECEQCGAYTRLTSYQARKFGHLYFIPILPEGPRSQILRECKKCNMGTMLPVKELEPMVDRLADQFKSWIMEIQDGRNEVVPADGEESVNVGHLIAGILEDLYCLKEIEGVETISTILTSSNLSYENEVVLGRWNEMQGDLEGARLNFQAAQRAKPQEPMPIYQLGSVLSRAGKYDEAVSAYEQYAKLVPEDVSVLSELSRIHQVTKNYPEIVKTYDKIFTMYPDVMGDKKMKKAYKQACKKSGLQGQFLDQL